MESEKDMVMIPNLNTLVKLFDLRIALLETIQKVGYDKPSENRALAINLSFAGMMYWIFYLLMCIAVEKVVAAKANSELSSVTAELTRALAETESLRHQLDSSRASEEGAELESAGDELEKMLKHSQRLETELKSATDRLKQAEAVQSESARDKDRLQYQYDELNESLRHQLNRSSSLRKAFKKDVLDGMDVKEMIERLLKQEKLQSIAEDSLKAERDRLSCQVDRLQQDIERWKNMSQTRTPRLNGTSSHAQPQQMMQEEVMRLFALYRQAEVHRKALIVQKRYLQCQVDAFFQTQQSALLMMADMGAPVDLNCHPPKSKYPRGYARFKAAGCAIVATFRFQYILKRKMHHLRSHINKLQRLAQKSSPAHVRGVLSASTATTLASKENVSPGAAIDEDITDTAIRKPSVIGVFTGIETAPSGFVANISQPSTSRVFSQTGTALQSSSVQFYPRVTTTSQYNNPSSRTPDSHSGSHSSRSGFPYLHSVVKPLQQHQETHSPQMKKSKRSKVSPSRNEHTSTTTYSSTQKQKPSTNSPVMSHVDSSQDPHLVAYIKGLEKLKARLSKASM